MAEYTVVYNAQEFTQLLMHIANSVPTRYKNSFPYNCGYYNGDRRFTFDCWNLPKAIIWGWVENKTVGYYCYEPGKNGLGDWTGGYIMNRCREKSTDFSSIVPGEFLMTPNNDHAGVYVGEFYDRGGTLCNVVECTTGWDSNGVIGSWVDTDGTRRAWKGGPASVCWGRHGKLPWIDYTNKPKYNVIDVDGWWGSDTTWWTQKLLGCSIVDGIVSYQAKSDQKYLPRCTPYNGNGGSWEFNYAKCGSNVIKAIQKLVGVDPDGHCGYNTVCAIQRFLIERGLYTGAIDGSMGPGTVKGWQIYINDLANK